MITVAAVYTHMYIFIVYPILSCNTFHWAISRGSLSRNSYTFIHICFFFTFSGAKKQTYKNGSQSSFRDQLKSAQQHYNTCSNEEWDIFGQNIVRIFIYLFAVIGCVTFLVICACAFGLPQIASILWANKYPPGYGPVVTGIKAVIALTPCTPERTPTSLSFRSSDECSDRCPGHCASCNSTCIFGHRCVCGAGIYCTWNPDSSKVQPGARIPEICEPIENFIERD